MTVDLVLERDLQWREAELASLKRLAISSPEDSPAHRGLLRAMWALLYAHFEGFTTLCWDTVLDHIQAAAVPTDTLERKFRLLALEPQFRLHRGNLDPSAILEFFETALPTTLTQPAFFPEDSRLKTDSNLWPNVFERESERIGIKCEELEKSRARIRSLVARRNDIAHGKLLTIESLEEYGKYENATLCVMHELAIKSIDVIEKELYRSQPLGVGG